MWEPAFSHALVATCLEINLSTKNVKMPKKTNLTSKQHAKHPFTGQNTQQLDSNLHVSNW